MQVTSESKQDNSEALWKILRDGAAKLGGELLSTSADVKQDVRLSWRCSGWHHWTAYATAVLVGNWCYTCGMTTMSEELKPFGHTYDYRKKYLERYFYKCPKGHEWSADLTEVRRRFAFEEPHDWCDSCVCLKHAANSSVVQSIVAYAGMLADLANMVASYLPLGNIIYCNLACELPTNRNYDAFCNPTKFSVAKALVWACDEYNIDALTYLRNYICARNLSQMMANEDTINAMIESGSDKCIHFMIYGCGFDVAYTCHRCVKVFTSAGLYCCGKKAERFAVSLQNIAGATDA